MREELIGRQEKLGKSKISEGFACDGISLTL